MAKGIICVHLSDENALQLLQFMLSPDLSTTLAVRDGDIGHPKGVELHVSEAEHKRIKKNHGGKVHLTKSDVEANIEGEGFFSDLWAKAKHHLAPIVRALAPHAKNLAKEHGEKAIALAGEYAHKGIAKVGAKHGGKNAFVDMAIKHAHSAVERGREEALKHHGRLDEYADRYLNPEVEGEGFDFSRYTKFVVPHVYGIKKLLHDGYINEEPVSLKWKPSDFKSKKEEMDLYLTKTQIKKIKESIAKAELNDGSSPRSGTCTIHMSRPQTWFNAEKMGEVKGEFQKKSKRARA